MPLSFRYMLTENHSYILHSRAGEVCHFWGAKDPILRPWTVAAGENVAEHKFVIDKGAKTMV